MKPLDSMKMGSFEIFEDEIIIRFKQRVCETPEELFHSKIFCVVIRHGVEQLEKRQ